MPNPVGGDSASEQIRVRNETNSAVSLDGWKVSDSRNQSWILNAGDGTVTANGTAFIVRQGRSMSLNNTGGDTITLLRPTGEQSHQVSYSGTIASGDRVEFN